MIIGKAVGRHEPNRTRLALHEGHHARGGAQKGLDPCGIEGIAGLVPQIVLRVASGRLLTVRKLAVARNPQNPAAERRCAPEHLALFQDDDIQPLDGGGDGGPQTARARTHHDHVVHFVPGRSHCPAGPR